MNNSSTFNILSIFKLIWEKKIKFGVTLFIIFLIGIISINLIPKTYKCESTIKVFSKNEYDATNLFLNDTKNSEGTDHEASAAKITILSSDFLEEIVKELNLVSDYKINESNNEVNLNLAINKLRSNISIKDLQTNNMLQIRVSDVDRNRTIQISNKILDNFQKRKSKSLTGKNKEILSQLKSSIDFKKIKIDSITRIISSIRAKYKIITSSNSLNNMKNTNFNEGYFSNYDLVMTYENELKELNKSMTDEINKFYIFNSISNSNYPAFEILEAPYLPLSPTNFNSILVYILIFLMSFIISIFTLFSEKLREFSS